MSVLMTPPRGACRERRTQTARWNWPSSPSAVRRYYWIVILGAVLGAGLGLFLGGGGADQYESRAVLLVSPPTQSRAVFNVSDVADRYVTGQLSVLASQGLAAEVAETLGDDTTIEEVAGAVSFEREPLTDVVHVLARSPDPERAQAIGDAYVTAYMNALQSQLIPTPRTRRWSISMARSPLFTARWRTSTSAWPTTWSRSSPATRSPAWTRWRRASSPSRRS